jgi:uncharacterized SAM-binding protein YcdF (DUF218 family)
MRRGQLIRRIISLLLLGWVAGFVWFAVALPQPAGKEHADAVVVLTGAPGRISRGIEALQRGWSPRMFVSGVYRAVKPHEFAVEYRVSPAMMACCVTLGFAATDTRSNAAEIAAWMRRERVRSVRLVTSDWHMRRAALELGRAAPAGVAVVEDAVQTQPTLRILFLEYHKYLARLVGSLWGG